MNCLPQKVNWNIISFRTNTEWLYSYSQNSISIKLVIYCNGYPTGNWQSSIRLNFWSSCLLDWLRPCADSIIQGFCRPVIKVSNLDTIHLINKIYYSRLVFFNKLSATKGKLKNSCLQYESLIRNSNIYTVRIAFLSNWSFIVLVTQRIAGSLVYSHYR